MPRDFLSLDFGPEADGLSGSTTIAALRSDAPGPASLRTETDHRAILGAAETPVFQADFVGPDVAEVSVSIQFEDIARGDSFEFRGDFELPADGGIQPDAPIDIIRAIIAFLRNRNADTYTSGEGENGVFSDFNIEVVFKGTGWTDALKDTFILASEYLSTIIIGDIADSGDIDDVRIEAQISDIDGEGGVLGQAGPTSLRGPGANWLTKEGIMEFDVADADSYLAQGLFDDIVVHEMMHVLGIGTLWDLNQLTTGSVAGGDMRFTGENAILAYETEFAAIAAGDPDSGDGVPVETDGGSGTAGGHWDEDTFGNEVMTGYIGGVPTYQSSMTVASLEDLGYETIWDANDPTAAIPQLDDILIV